VRRFSLRASVDGERFTRRVVRERSRENSHSLTRTRDISGVGLEMRAQVLEILSKNARLRVTYAMHG
jgi:hypothetical protein